METLILGWYVLVETGSVLLLTVFGSLQFLGTLISPMFGVIGDRIGHRNLLLAMRATYIVLAFNLMVLALSGLLGPVSVFIIAALMGLVRPSDLVMRNALVGETMPPGLLLGAMGVSRTTSDSARTAGSLAGAGLVAAFGIGPAYVVIAMLYALSFVLTLGIAGAPAKNQAALALPRLSPWRDLKDGIVYVWTTPRLLAAMWLAFLVNLTAFPLSSGLLPFVARDVYHVGQTGLGYLVASFAFGALLGSIALSMTSRSIRPARMMILFCVFWYLMLLVFSQAETALAGGIMLTLAGFMQSLGMIPMAVMLLRTSSEPFRGRVMGVRMLAVYGLPLGLLAAGWLIGRIGFAHSASLYCVIGLVFTLLIALRWRADLWRIDAVGNRQ